MGSGGAARTGLSPSAAGLSRPLRSPLLRRLPVPLPRRAGPAVWASSAFARRYLRNHRCLLFLRLLRCFTSPGLAPAAIWVLAGAPPSRGAGCPIRKPPDRRPHAPPRGFSQLAASFIACRRQGIRRAPVQPGRQNRRQAGPACSSDPKVCCLTKKRRCAADLPPRTPFQGEMSLPPAHKGAGDVLYLAGGRANPRPKGGRGPPSLSLAKDLKPA